MAAIASRFWPSCRGTRLVTGTHGVVHDTEGQLSVVLLRGATASPRRRGTAGADWCFASSQAGRRSSVAGAANTEDGWWFVVSSASRAEVMQVELADTQGVEHLHSLR